MKIKRQTRRKVNARQQIHQERKKVRKREMKKVTPRYSSSILYAINGAWWGEVKTEKSR